MGKNSTGGPRRLCCGQVFGFYFYFYFFTSPGPASRCSKCNAKPLPVRDLYLAFVTNFSVRSSIRLLFLSLRGESKRGSSETDWRRNAGVLVAVNGHFSSIETYCSSASAILSRSHVLDCDCCVRERQSCGKSSQGFLKGKCALFLG